MRREQLFAQAVGYGIMLGVCGFVGFFAVAVVKTFA